jgi:hypothetical protein
MRLEKLRQADLNLRSQECLDVGEDVRPYCFAAEITSANDVKTGDALLWGHFPDGRQFSTIVNVSASHRRFGFTIWWNL